MRKRAAKEETDQKTLVRSWLEIKLCVEYEEMEKVKLILESFAPIPEQNFASDAVSCRSLTRCLVTFIYCTGMKFRVSYSTTDWSDTSADQHVYLHIVFTGCSAVPEKRCGCRLVG